jgi:hypothetical protein
MRKVATIGGYLLLALSGCSSSGASGGAGTPLTGGTGGASGGVALTPNCAPDNLVPVAGTNLSTACSSYVTPTADGTGIVTQLGSYGAVAENNVGQGYEITPNAQDTVQFCTTFAQSFGEDPKLTAQVLDLRGTDLQLYTVFRPARWVEGEKYPIITWGNGTCAQPGAYAALLMDVASHGFFVVAANGRFVANGAQTKALDFVFAANEDSTSPYYHRLDTTKVGAMGHSQGSAATVAAAADSRIQAAICFNGGAVPAPKPFLAVSGDRDINNPTVDSYRTMVNAAPEGAFVFFHNVPQTGGTLTGHLTLMMQPDRAIAFTAGWWEYILNGDTKARDLFVGASCGLCGQDADFEYGENGLK